MAGADGADARVRRDYRGTERIPRAGVPRRAAAARRAGADAAVRPGRVARDAIAKRAGGDHGPADGREVLPLPRVLQELEAVHHLVQTLDATRTRSVRAAGGTVHVQQLLGDHAHTGRFPRAQEDGAHAQATAENAEKHDRVPVVPVRLVRQVLAHPAHEAQARVRERPVLRLFDPVGVRERVQRVPGRALVCLQESACLVRSVTADGWLALRQCSHQQRNFGRRRRPRKLNHIHLDGSDIGGG